MSSRRSLSRESRSYYSRSSSCDNNNRFQSSTYRRRPLSSLLIDRDFSSPITSLAIDRFDDPFFFDRPSRRIFDDFDRRLRWQRWNNDDDFLREDIFRNDPSFDFGRNISINNQSSSGVTRNIPVQYSPSSWNSQRERVYTKLDQGGNNWSTNSSLNNQGNFQSKSKRLKKIESRRTMWF